jgi:hypothetical protein
MYTILQKPNGVKMINMTKLRRERKNNLIIPTESKKLDRSMSKKGLTEEHMHRLL